MQFVYKDGGGAFTHDGFPRMQRLLGLIRVVMPRGANILGASLTLVHLPCRNESGWTEMTGVWIQLLWRLIYCTSDLMVAEEDRRRRREHTYARTTIVCPH